jgi:organic hydroperoxide reductase OsmC/OhrA
MELERATRRSTRRSTSSHGQGGFYLSVSLDVTLPSIEDQDQAKQLVAALPDCPYSNATRGNIEVALTANGAPVD